MFNKNSVVIHSLQRNGGACTYLNSVMRFSPAVQNQNVSTEKNCQRFQTGTCENHAIFQESVFKKPWAPKPIRIFPQKYKPQLTKLATKLWRRKMLKLSSSGDIFKQVSV